MYSRANILNLARLYLWTRWGKTSTWCPPAGCGGSQKAVGEKETYDETLDDTHNDQLDEPVVDYTLDMDELLDAVEAKLQTQMGGGGGCPCGHTVWTTVSVFERDFVWGLQYIDELVVQYDDRSLDSAYDLPTTLYTLTDASYNVVGLAGDAGWYRQYRYKPYGEMYEADKATNYEGGNFTPAETGSVEDPSIVNLANFNFHHGLFRDPLADADYNRGRYRNYKTGRFNSPDPNGQALQLSNVMRRNAQTAAVFASLNMRGQYNDGGSLYGYARNNPITGTDPSGLAAYTSLELLVVQGTRSYLRTAMWFAIGGMAYTGMIGANQAVINARYSGADARGMVRAAILGSSKSMSSAETLGAILLFSAIAATGPAGFAAAGVLMVGAGIMGTNEAIDDIGAAQNFEELDLAMNRGFWAGTQAFMGATMMGWPRPGRGILAGARQKAIIPEGIAAEKIPGEWPAAISPRSGKIYVKTLHSAAIELAQEGAIMKTGIKSGSVNLNSAGEVIWTNWEKTW